MLTEEAAAAIATTGAIIEFVGFIFTGVSLFRAWRGADGFHYKFLTGKPKPRSAHVQVSGVAVGSLHFSGTAVGGDETELERKVRELRQEFDALKESYVRQVETRDRMHSDLRNDLAALREETVTGAKSDTRKDVRLAFWGVFVVLIGSALQLRAMLGF